MTDTYIAAIFLGILQGIAEWLPVSSEGTVAAAYALVFDEELGDAVGYALWLHIGTVPSAIIVLRHEIMDLVREAMSLVLKRKQYAVATPSNQVATSPGSATAGAPLQNPGSEALNPRPAPLKPGSPSPFLRFVVVATLVGGGLGFPLLLVLKDVSDVAGPTAMGVIGGFMLITGAAQLLRRERGHRTRDDVTLVDGVLTGVAQAFSVIPGLSRSGSTIATLLARRVDGREALVLSFILSIPVSLGASIYAGISEGLFLDSYALVAVIAAFITGLLTIKVVLALAVRVNFGAFVLIIGSLMVAGALWETFG